MTGGFEALGDFAEGGARALALAVDAARTSFGEGRVPIAGAAVHVDEGGALSTVAVGCNGRIPERGTSGAGYPSDHGETAAVRGIERFEVVEWSRVVFATTLAPCIMCTRLLIELHARGLDKIVIAESTSFAGARERLADLPGATVVELESEECVRLMRSFSRTYPWDWAADVGEVPAGDLAFVAALARDPGLQRELLARVAAVGAGRASAGIAGCTGADCGATQGSTQGSTQAADDALSVIARDERDDSGGNPTRSAPMLAIGRAGSALNLRECALVCSAADGAASLGIEALGMTALGACELFRPALLLADRPPQADLAAALAAAHVQVLLA